MKKLKGRMDESILVCVYYGPNGERLIRRGCQIASMLDCPLYILTIDPKPFDEMDAEKSHYITRWKQLAEHFSADAFILKDNDKRPVSKVIADVAREKALLKLFSVKQLKAAGNKLPRGPSSIHFFVKFHLWIFILFLCPVT